MLVKLLIRIRNVDKTSILGFLQYWALLYVLYNSSMLVLSYSFWRFWEIVTLAFWPKGWVLVFFFSGCIFFLCRFSIVSLFLLAAWVGKVEVFSPFLVWKNNCDPVWICILLSFCACSCCLNEVNCNPFHGSIFLSCLNNWLDVYMQITCLLWRYLF